MSLGHGERTPKRREDFRLLTGRGRFTADLHLPGQVHLAFVRSPHAHAAIRRIDVGNARAAPGVLAVFTAADLAADGLGALPQDVNLTRPGGYPPPASGRPILAEKLVRHVGEPVVAVAAENPASAVAAAELVSVDYEERPMAVDLESALAADAPAVWPDAADNISFLWRHGDDAATDRAFRSATHVARGCFRISRVAVSPMEARGAVATADEAGGYVLYTGHQQPYGLRDALARLIPDLDPKSLRVVAPDIGGSFGLKTGVHSEEVIVLWAARRLGRSVRWVEDRSEAFLADDQARDVILSVSLALDAERNFLALKVRYEINIGAYLSTRSIASINNVGGIAGAYRTPLIVAEVAGVYTHSVPTGPYRGAGRPEATYAIERVIDIAARELGMDAFDLRRRNLVPASAMPFKTGLTFVYDCGDFAACMDRAAVVADMAGFSARRRKSAEEGRLRGLGISCPVEVAGGPYGRPGKDRTHLRVAGDGTIALNAGVLSTGQGLETSLSHLVSTRLSVPLDAIVYAQGDTGLLTVGRGSGGSSGMAVGGTTVVRTVDAIIEKGRQVAADALEVAEADVEFADGHFGVVGTDRRVSIFDVARHAERADPQTGLAATVDFQPADVTFPNGCHICEVEIDPETGVVEVKRYAAVEDVGTVLNPVLVEGQMHGGIAQGIGQALGEAIVSDRASGQLLTGSFMDYAMPRAGDLPSFRSETLAVPTKANPLGAKGVGEAGTVGALAATLNAVCDALAPLGIVDFDMPATPSRVWTAIAGRHTTG